MKRISPKSALLSLFLVLASLLMKAQSGIYVVEMEIGPELGLIVNSSMLQGLKEGKYLASADPACQKSLTYSDVTRGYQEKELLELPVQQLLVSIEFDLISDSGRVLAWKPVYKDVGPDFYIRQSDLLLSMRQLDYEKVLEIEKKVITCWLKVGMGESACSIRKNISIRKIKLNSDPGLLQINLEQLPEILTYGLRSGKYIAFGDPELTQGLAFEDVNQDYSSIEEEADLSVIKAIWVGEKWEFQDNAEKSMSGSTIGFTTVVRKKLMGIGLEHPNGRISWYRWTDIYESLQWAGFRGFGDLKMSSQNLNFPEVYRLLLQSHFARAVGFKVVGP